MLILCNKTFVKNWYITIISNKKINQFTRKRKLFRPFIHLHTDSCCVRVFNYLVLFLDSLHIFNRIPATNKDKTINISLSLATNSHLG